MILDHFLPMLDTDFVYRPQSIVARRVKEERKRLGWTQKDLARRLAELGHGNEDQQPTIARIESGKRTVPIDELFALAAALETSPVYLLTPLDESELVAVTPRVTIPANAARAWLRGAPVPMGPQIDLAALPESELFRLVKANLERQVGRISVLFSAQQQIDEWARNIVEQIRNPEPKEGGNDG
jgi:transcriptional regulator with XRE-family HTH domain